ncbi:metallophosphoesterase family protein [Bacillus alkalicellulosilyticus]|uniref:metallophosphoesterase family protein n=1 Tax=Alkalihalobacterium alkalicellulosilyticum TaxID=1912214 RepID=UPI000995E559|nr:metallophosphoesterase family protein [Bacillus alkalicellulosilyticus]
MDKIAIISDIHGNIPALEAVVTDIKERNIQTIFCLGDMVGKGPHSELAVDFVKATCEVVIQGNWDQLMPQKQKEKEFVWHQKRLGLQRLNYLANLPFYHDFYMSGKLIRLVHASPQSVHHRVQPWDSLEKKLAMFESTENTDYTYQMPDIVGYGDIHNAFIQHIEKKTLFNSGSVGNPLDVPQASYVILEGRYQSETEAPISIQFTRVPYDVDLAIQNAIDEKMPKLQEYIDELRTGIYRGLKN